jgi:hypothetical protein
MQTTTQIYPDRAELGQRIMSIYDINDTLAVDSSETSGITVALGIVKRPGLINIGRLPRINKATLVFDADLVASNLINMKVNGSAISQVTFSGTHAATMGLIITALKAKSTVYNAVLDSNDISNRTIIVYGNDNIDIAITDAAVTAGNSDANIAVTSGSWDFINGIIYLDKSRMQTFKTNLNVYDAYDVMGILRRGKVIVNAETIVKNGDPVYCRFDNSVSGSRGAFRNDSDSGKAFLVNNAMWAYTTTTINGLAEIELNQPMPQ